MIPFNVWKKLYEGSEVTDKLKPDTKLTVYHGTNEPSIKKMLTGGIDATKVNYRKYNQGRERGLYVTDDFNTAKKFGNYIIEFECLGKDLFPTARFGASKETRSDKKTNEYMDTKYPDSFRKFTSYTFRNPSEPQAMFIGFIPVKSINKIYHFDYGEKSQPIKEMTVDEVKEKLNIDGFDWNLNMSAEEVIQELSTIEDYPVEKIIEALKMDLKHFVELYHIPRKLKFRIREYLSKR